MNMQTKVFTACVILLLTVQCVCVGLLVKNGITVHIKHDYTKVPPATEQKQSPYHNSRTGKRLENLYDTFKPNDYHAYPFTGKEPGMEDYNYFGGRYFNPSEAGERFLTPEELSDLSGSLKSGYFSDNNLLKNIDVNGNVVKN